MSFVSNVNDLSMIFKFRVNLLDGLPNHIIKRNVVLPSPVLERGAVIEGARPCLSDLLSEVRPVLDSEVGDELFHRSSKLLRRETDACKVVHSTPQLSVIGIQKIHSCLDAVINVDHRKEGLRLKETLVVTIFKSFEEDF